MAEKEKRWIYSDWTKKWYLVGPEDKDYYVWGITQEDFKKMGEEEATKQQLSGSFIGKGNPGNEYNKSPQSIIAEGINRFTKYAMSYSEGNEKSEAVAYEHGYIFGIINAFYESGIMSSKKYQESNKKVDQIEREYIRK